ncbi:Putative phage tail assembly protein [Pseudomonas brassicacearum subsp. brassicacearum NFM421]|uniref:Putative phage tail assembly protein n=2 Tax=Pseudomonas brassicacearum TaxID=930166 RepID=F2KJE2_PSEBN|nr:Putative phage tail assembly protein [Pseudomonas brassicacearum subsp. brassicacearum NFM421]
MAATLSNPAMTTILLSGPLIKLFGRVHYRELGSKSVGEAFKALKCTLDGFEAAIRSLERKGMRFAIFRNRQNMAEKDFALGGAQEIRIVPVVSGSKRAGLLQTIIGAVLIVAGSYFGQTWAVQLGVGLVAGGVIQMLSPQASGLKQSASPDNAPSYAFGSAKNTTASGNPVPICIGDRRWGGMIISASIYAEDKT